jgi:hypothetical protein
MVALRRLNAEDIARLGQFWREHWGGEEIIVQGEMFRPSDVERFATEDWCGVVTYTMRSDECEIISLNSLPGRGGIGHRAVDEVRKRRPGIPLTGENGIPLRDEIELEMRLQA